MNQQASSTWRRDVEVGVVTHVGMVRSENQDYYGFWEPEEDDILKGKGRLLVVCDGMGGHNGGTVASRTSVDAILESFKKSDTFNLKRLLSTAIDSANASVRQKGEQDATLRNMGTTCVATAIRGSQIQIAHIGDSRAYYLHDGVIEQVTRDHTYLNDLIDIGLLTPERAKNHPERNIITRCVGMGDVVQVDFTVRQAKPGSAFLLCSDGLFNHVEDDEILDLVTSREAQDAAQELVDLANRRGGEDNITVGIIKVRSVPAEFDEMNAQHPVAPDMNGQVTPIMTIGPSQRQSAASRDTGGSLEAESEHTSSSKKPGPSRKGWMLLLALELVLLIILQALIK